MVASLRPPVAGAAERGVESPLLAIRGLVAAYGARRALSGIDLDVFAGEVLAVAGENGAGKSTLVRCIAGDLTPTAGEIILDGERIRAGTSAITRRGVAVVWQDLALCDNLDVASNLLLGRERRRMLLSDARFHVAARRLLASLGIPIPDTTAPVGSLSGGQRQLLAVARAMQDRPRLLILDEPTASLGVSESKQVERITRRLSDEGTTILLISHDIDQMFRLADRIAVIRHGQLVANVPTARGYPDEIVALMSGQPVDSSPRRQLDRLHSLVGRLSSVDPSSSLAVILSALGTALAADRLCIHLVHEDRLHLTASVGLPEDLLSAWRELPMGPARSPAGAAASTGSTVIDPDVRQARTWDAHLEIAERVGIRSSWSVPVSGSGGLLGVITVFRRNRGTPHRDELDLVSLYAGYAASAAERDALLGQVTARNSVLETIRVVLEQLAVSVPLSPGLAPAVEALRSGLGADEVGLLGWDPQSGPVCRCWSGPGGAPPPGSPVLHALRFVLNRADDAATATIDVDGARILAAKVPAPGGPLALLAAWRRPADTDGPDPDADALGLVEDAAHSFQLALERETSEQAHREAAALRRSQELQQTFLSRLSHELRTPLTAIHGYADSLLQTDVTWDSETQNRFLSRIASESARLGRLVGDLLDLSAIESDILRLQRDWCDLALIVDAARACLPLESLPRVHLECDSLPPVWADHDRLEQVLVNLMDNAIRHNPPGTTVTVHAAMTTPQEVTVTVRDDGIGLPEPSEGPVDGADRPPAPTAGSGLGLSIARAIVDAHGGTLALEPIARGTCWRIDLPIGGDSDVEVANAAAADG
jgi:ABC-type multidrug transport system ATPase subunit/signal transduction histidine kinase